MGQTTAKGRSLGTGVSYGEDSGASRTINPFAKRTYPECIDLRRARPMAGLLYIAEFALTRT